MGTKKFKINPFLTLRLDGGGKTVIYVAGKRFRTCKYLLFTMTEADAADYADIESIDEAIERYSRAHENNHALLDPETEFWGHCSNLQAWAEHDYDTRLLDMWLAFPLLRRLTDAGDPGARRAFAEEIAKRLEAGTLSVRQYLIRVGYLKYLTEEERTAVAVEWVKHDSKINLFDMQWLFPLLKEVVDGCGSIALEPFKEMIAKRLKGGSLSVKRYLIEEGYTDYLTEEEIAVVISEWVKHDAETSPLNNFFFLKKLVDIPGSAGRKAYREEISKQLNTGAFAVRRYLIDKGYVDLLTGEERAVMASEWVEHRGEKIPVIGNILSLDDRRIANLNEVKGLFELKSLECLDLRRNALTELPEALAKLTTLKELNLNGNSIKDLPDFVSKLTSLKILSLSGNQIEAFPKLILGLPSLERLRLSVNKLTELPESIGELDALRMLYLANNEFTALPESIGKLSSLKRLDLSKNRLEQVPESIGELTTLRELYISENNLTEIPESIGNLTKLTYLSLGWNNLTELPESLGNLVSLQNLNVCNNNLTELSASLGDLVNLKDLDISDNEFTELPECLGKLTSLQILHIYQNKLTELPEFLAKLRSLRELRAFDNKITHYPELIEELLQSLEIFDFRGNEPPRTMPITSYGKPPREWESLEPETD